MEKEIMHILEELGGFGKQEQVISKMDCARPTAIKRLKGFQSDKVAVYHNLNGKTFYCLRSETALRDFRKFLIEYIGNSEYAVNKFPSVFPALAEEMRLQTTPEQKEEHFSRAAADIRAALTGMGYSEELIQAAIDFAKAQIYATK